MHNFSCVLPVCVNGLLLSACLINGPSVINHLHMDLIPVVTIDLRPACSNMGSAYVPPPPQLLYLWVFYDYQNKQPVFP